MMLVSPLGCAERKLVDFDANDATPTDFTWARDGRSLAVSLGRAGIYRIWLDTLEKERLTTPSGSDFGDSSPAFTPDGRSLVFARLPTASSTDIYLQPIGGKPSPLLKGAPRISGVVMVPNSQEILYEMGGLGLATRRQRPMGQNSRLWRMPIDGRASPEPLAGLPEGAGAPAIFQSANGKMFLAFEKRVFDVNIWFMALEGAHAPHPLINSTRIDSNPQFSPDGQRIAFTSDRSGSLEIWVCKSDGTNATQLTYFGTDMVHAPRWSPDGRRIAFSVLSHGNRDGRPSWSQDGKWIYFYSNRSGTQQVWKRSLADGRTLQVTRGGGHEAFESPDGKVVIYTRPDVPGLWTVPVGGQTGDVAETKLLDHARQSTWAVTKDGVYFVDFEKDFKSGRPLYFYRFSTRSVHHIASIQGEIGPYNTEPLRIERW
jgi:Tol biopolymer transport system component